METPQANCKRCGRPFTPEKTRLKKMPMTRCCDECKVRNLMDGLGLPTPPNLLDPFTTRPTLTDQEYKRELAKTDELDPIE